MIENTYNPMSKEFQGECKRLGLTGRQLIIKYKTEGKSFNKGQYIRHYNRPRGYTKNELLDILTQSYKDLGRPPSQNDFSNNPKYPSIRPYIDNFGSWSNALKIVGLDVESIVKKGIVETDDQKARLSEIIIRDSFDNFSIDLAGKNKNSPCDGICPTGKNYDVKSCGLHKTYYQFRIYNKYKEEIELYYLLAFNKDYTKLNYGWKIPGEIVESDSFLVGITCRAKFTVESMKEYDITEKLREILIKYGYFEKIINYIKAKEKGMTIYEYDKQLYDGCIIAE
jgi:hypothetical protein